MRSCHWPRFRPRFKSARPAAVCCMPMILLRFELRPGIFNALTAEVVVYPAYVSCSSCVSALILSHGAPTRTSISCPRAMSSHMHSAHATLTCRVLFHAVSVSRAPSRESWEHLCRWRRGDATEERDDGMVLFRVRSLQFEGPANEVFPIADQHLPHLEPQKSTFDPRARKYHSYCSFVTSLELKSFSAS